MSNHKLRVRRLFAGDGRSLLIALDHLSRPGAGVRMHDPGKILREVDAAGVDGVLLRAGVARNHAKDLGRTSLVLSHPRDFGEGSSGVELALRLGADAIKTEVLPGSSVEPRSVANFAALAAECDRWELPLIGEMLPVGFEAKDQHTPDKLCDVARLGSDLGADVVKTKYTGDRESFAKLVTLADVPVLVLGGAKGDLRQLFMLVNDALEAGAAGAAIGRSVWEAERPGRIAGALVRLVHERVDVDAALAEAERVVVGLVGR